MSAATAFVPTDGKDIEVVRGCMRRLPSLAAVQVTQTSYFDDDSNTIVTQWFDELGANFTPTPVEAAGFTIGDCKAQNTGAFLFRIGGPASVPTATDGDILDIGALIGPNETLQALSITAKAGTEAAGPNNVVYEESATSAPKRIALNETVSWSEATATAPIRHVGKRVVCTGNARAFVTVTVARK
jgi:hypothetical protein